MRVPVAEAGTFRVAALAALRGPTTKNDHQTSGLFAQQQFFIHQIIIVWRHWGTGIRGLMRGMATLPQGNQELLVVRDKVGRPQVSLG